VVDIPEVTLRARPFIRLVACCCSLPSPLSRSRFDISFDTDTMTSSNTELMYKMYDTEFDEAELEAAAESSEAAASSVRGLARCRTIVQRFPVMMAYTHEEGRFVYAKMAMGAGDMVMFALPYVWVVHEAYRSKVCSFCIKDLVKIRMPCSTCRQVFYCSRECKNNDHEIHQDECRILASWQVAAGDVYDVDFVRDIKLLVRTLARRTAEKRLRMNKESMSHLHSWDNRHLFKDYCLLQSLSYTAAIEATSSSSSSTTSTTTTSTNATTSSAPSVDASNESACSTSSLDTAEQAAPDTAPTPAVGDASPISIQEATTTASSLDAAQQPLPPPPPPPPPALPGTLGEEYELIRETMARYVTQLRHWLGFKWETEEEMIDIVFRNSRNVFSFNNGRHRAPQATYVGGRDAAAGRLVSPIADLTACLVCVRVVASTFQRRSSTTRAIRTCRWHRSPETTSPTSDRRWCSRPRGRSRTASHCTSRTLRAAAWAPLEDGSVSRSGERCCGRASCSTATATCACKSLECDCKNEQRERARRVYVASIGSRDRVCVIAYNKERA